MVRFDGQPKDEQRMLRIPNMLENWPWPRMINPHYEEVGAQSNAWFRSLKAFSPRSQYAFDKCDFCRLVALAYPTASKEHLRTGCDLMNLFFLIDEYTDVEPAPGVREMVDIVIDALLNPAKPRPGGEVVLGQVTKEFWALAVQTTSPPAQKRFLATFITYLESVIAQAEDRQEKNIHSVGEYMKFRCENIGARPCFVLCALDLNLPEDVFCHPIIEELEYLSADMMILGNDIVSYNKEQANGDDQHNILTIAMIEFKIDLDGAVRWAEKYHEELEEKFLERMKCVPSWGPEVDKDVGEYINRVAAWVRANDCWSFESGRYFGSKGQEIQKTRCVPLFAKSRKASGQRRGNVDVALIEL